MSYTPNGPTALELAGVDLRLADVAIVNQIGVVRTRAGEIFVAFVGDDVARSCSLERAKQDPRAG